MTDPQDKLPTWVVSFLFMVLVIAVLAMVGISIGWIE